MYKTMFSLAAVVAISVPHLAVAANPDCPNLEEVIIASKNHLDVGFTCTVPALMRRIRTSDAGGVLNLLDADRSKPEEQWVRWTLPAWSMDVMLGGTYAPERRARLEESVRMRRLLCQAMPFTIETEASDLEEMVRLLSYGSDISRRFGIDLPRHAKQTDVPEQGWALPAVLANAGVKYLHIGINEGCKQNEDLANIPPLCWWEGPDGSRILLGYCSNYGEIRRGPFKPPKGWKHKTYLAYYTRGDNQGPISPKDAERVLNEVRTALPGVRVRFGDPAEFADAIAAEEKENPRLPVIRGDMPDTWIHGQMTAPEETALHRHAQTELITLGVLDTTLRALGVETKPISRVLDRGYRKSGLYSEHTWGRADANASASTIPTGANATSAATSSTSIPHLSTTRTTRATRTAWRRTASRSVWRRLHRLWMWRDLVWLCSIRCRMHATRRWRWRCRTAVAGRPPYQAR